MTVCIATFCSGPFGPMIVGATDRMLTAGIVEFEPRVSKIHKLTRDCVALSAGEMDVQSAVCAAVESRKPQTVLAAAEAFSAELCQHNRKQAERTVLAPLGFTMRSFFDKQVHLSADFIDGILHKIRQERANTQTIVCGVNSDGTAHIYTIDDGGHISYRNSVGFAAIGDGAWHAESQFMFGRFDQFWTLARSLMLTFVAKRRAEVAPGVGKDTDLFFVTPKHGFAFFHQNVYQGLVEAYEQMEIARDGALESAHDHLEKYLEELVKAAEQSKELTSPTTQADAPQVESRPQPNRRKPRNKKD